MIKLLKQYKAFVFGLVSIPMMFLLEAWGFLIIPRTWSLELVLIFIFWWLAISLLIHHRAGLKKRSRTIRSIILLLLLLTVTMIVDWQFRMPDNPLTLVLLTSFWLGVFYLIFPDFFKKYRWAILGMYGVVFVHFTYVRLGSASFDVYLTEKKHFSLALLLFPIPLIIGALIYEQLKMLKTLKTDKIKAELELLKTQVNPHFFFNTLNNLYSLSVRNSEEAPAVILKLSDMMRYTIYEGKKEWVSLKYEIEYLQNYLDLHQIRYHKKVNIHFNSEYDGGEEVAPLLFIVLLENALKHGVESLSDLAYLKMDLKSSEGKLSFVIENNFDPEEQNGTPGIGLENLRQRLALIYPKKHDFQISENDHVFTAKLTLELK